MNKIKLCGLALTGLLYAAGLGTITANAAETNTGSATLSEVNKDKNSKDAAFDQKIKKAETAWQSLTKQQKEDIYALLEAEMDDEAKLLDKMAEYKVLDKTDADRFKAFKVQKLKNLRESGEFPLMKKKPRKEQ
ncbi:hypothetical protein [Anaerocolumna xylanovorans]|uniref:Uncharacterized protein n=1 Tax=Anaerocolumna xylanovorans DSM 12503 TaxID=1121345 RepID=A0A1M7Y835_9FIRM|nr:hypothetical protein [Anaerocolumna xylanovorans]SHO48716.1 hypothetical protein SAMN02745217_01995 [Anaerocolumna xylanovorans DSM 12503]